jgi:hypothetical protein
MATKERNMTQTLPITSEETVYLDIILWNIYMSISGILMESNFVIYCNSENAV